MPTPRLASLLASATVTTTIAAAAAPLVLLSACSERQPLIAIPAADMPKPATMSVIGTATLDVSPDCADLTMTLSTDGARPGQAVSAVQGEEKQLVATLAKLGLAGDDVKLSYLSLDPVYEPNPNGWAQIKVHSYRAQITVTATTHHFDQIGAIMDAGADAGATSMSSQFRRSDLPELKKKVRDLAIAAAKAKAKQMADGVGVTLGRVTLVGEAPSGAMWGNAYFPQANAAMSQGAATGGVGAASQQLSLDITIDYELAKEL